LNDGELFMLPNYIVGLHIPSGAFITILEAMVDKRTPIHAHWSNQNGGNERFKRS
jgi:hypothetical protein